MKVFEKISEYINKNSISITELSNNSGISENALCDMLDGKIPIDVSDLRALCLALQVPPERFI